MNFQVDGDSVVVGAVKYRQDGARVLEHGGKSNDDAISPFKRLGLRRMMGTEGLLIGVLSRDGREMIVGLPRMPAKKRLRAVTSGSLLAEPRRPRAAASARPFMGPALTKTLTKLPEKFRG